MSTKLKPSRGLLASGERVDLDYCTSRGARFSVRSSALEHDQPAFPGPFRQVKGEHVGEGKPQP